MRNRMGMLLGLVIFSWITSAARAEAPAPTKTPDAYVVPVVAAKDSPLAEPSHFRFGFEAGLTSSTVNCDDCSYYRIQSRSGVATGLVFEWLLGEKMAIELETMYVQKGIKYRDAADVQYNINYNMVELPISFKGRFGNQKIKGTVFGGPQIGVAVTRTYNALGGVKSSLPARDYDFGLHIGGGAEFQVSPKVNLFVNGRVNVGLVDLDIEKLLGTNDEVRSLGVLILSGVKFSF